MIAYTANLFVLYFSIFILDINEYLAQIVAGGAYVAIGFLGSAFFVFNNTNIN
jgi:hypothetical protein